MVRKKFDRTVVKRCPTCQQQVPVACKNCCCGHQFPTRSRQKSEGKEEEPEPVEVKTKRAVRTKRVRPDFFNPLEIEYSTKKFRTKEESGSSNESPRKRRGRPKGSINRTRSEDKPREAKPPPEEDMLGSLPPEKALQFSVILAELNRKLCTQHFSPV